MAEDAEVGNGTSSTTRSAENSLASMDMAEDAKVGKGDGGNDETVKQSPSKKPSVRTGILPPYAPKRWVSPDSFWPLLKLSVKSTIKKAIKQSSRWATQGSHSNQFLRKSTLHSYNKLSSCQVRGTYELSWYHSTSIIKLRLLGTSTLFECYVSSTTGFERS